MLSGAPSNYSVLNFFGCPVYAHVNNKKLESRSLNVSFSILKLVLNNINYGVKLWCPKTSKGIVSREVIFDETAMFHYSHSKNLRNKQQQSSSTYRTISRLVQELYQ